MTSTPRDPWIQLSSGEPYYLLRAPRAQAGPLDPVDVVEPLSRICRMGGHGERPLSVAGHSLLVHHILQAAGYPAPLLFEGLMHDAEEALIGDLTTPFKWALKTKGAEDALRIITLSAKEHVINSFGLMPMKMRHSHWGPVKTADLIALATERAHNFGVEPPVDWGEAWWSEYATAEPVALCRETYDLFEEPSIKETQETFYALIEKYTRGMAEDGR